MDVTYHEAIPAEVVSPVTKFKLVMDPVPKGTKMNTMDDIILTQQGATLTQVGKVVNGPEKDKKKMKKDSVKHAVDYSNKSKQKEKPFPKESAGSNGHVPSEIEHDRKNSVTKLSNSITSKPSNPHTSFHAENNKEITPEFVRENDLPSSLKDEAKTDVPSLQIDGSYHEARTIDVSSSQMDVTHHEAIPAEVVSPLTEIKLVIDSVPEGPKMKTMGEIILAQQGATIPQVGKTVNGPEKDEKKINKKDSLKHAIDCSDKSKQMEKPFPEEVAASNWHAPLQTEDDRKESTTKLSNVRTSMPSNPHTSCYAEDYKEITPEFVRENDFKDEAKTDVPSLQIHGAYDEARTTDVSSSQMDATHNEAIPAEVVSPVTQIKLVVDSVPEGPKMETMGETILAQQGATIPQVRKAVNGPEKDGRKMKKKDSLKNTIDYSNKSKQKEKPFPKETAVSNGFVPSQTKHDREKSATKMSNGRTSVPSNPHASLYAKTNKEITPKIVRENDLTSSQKGETETDVPSLQIHGAYHEAGTTDVSSSQMDITHHEAIPAEVVCPVTEIKLVVDSVPEDPKMETMGEILLAQQGAVNGPEKDGKKMMKKDSLEHAIDYSNKSKQKEKFFPKKEASSSNGHVPSQTKHDRKESATNLSNGRTSVPSNPNTSYYAKNLPCVPRKVGKEETIPKKKKPGLQARENKRSVSDSIHMSLCLGSQRPANITVPQPFVLATDRRVSIVQNLGDKEIVKCAFKTFRHSLSIPGLAKIEAPANVIRKEVAGSTTPHQKHGRSDDKSAQRCTKLVGSKDSEDKNGSSETSVNGRKLNSKVSSTTFSLKSVERAEKRKEFYMKLQEKLNAKEAEKNKIQAKTKVCVIL
ncbi:uncharacterized protein LOC131030425 [Cryptomeria japonica]|uniref:uncharacterized protein LOC131030425 n=1 Tax=Cryptomeria japonica TaxID=3369 RepID=UPI0027DA88C7|nr:uncharacterized protein LOC131030425 [Cryptomeria japonica]